MNKVNDLCHCLCAMRCFFTDGSRVSVERLFSRVSSCEPYKSYRWRLPQVRHSLADQATVAYL